MITKINYINDSALYWVKGAQSSLYMPNILLGCSFAIEKRNITYRYFYAPRASKFEECGFRVKCNLNK